MFPTLKNAESSLSCIDCIVSVEIKSGMLSLHRNKLFPTTYTHDAFFQTQPINLISFVMNVAQTRITKTDRF